MEMGNSRARATSQGHFMHTLCSIQHMPCQVDFYIGRMRRMVLEAKLSHTSAMILQAIHAGYVYGFSIMEMTGLPSGTVYPAMRRLERDELIHSHWENQAIADSEQRPARKYYKVSADG